MKKEMIEWGICIVIAIVLGLLVKHFIGTPTIVKSISMEPTLVEKQRLILNRISTNILKEMPKRGEIVTFEAPSKRRVAYGEANLKNPVAIYEYKHPNILSKILYYVLETGKTSYIKRVIALPGEHIQIKDGKVYINEEELNEDYLQQSVITDGGIFTDLVVPKDTVFVMGDNRPNSVDSRAFGCVPIDKLESKVWIRFWPFDLFGKVK